jgi:F0F1-type ATP synthase beta subunit
MQVRGLSQKDSLFFLSNIYRGNAAGREIPVSAYPPPEKRTKQRKYGRFLLTPPP